MEDEVRAICSELANSIRRESNLEQVVSELQERIFNLQAEDKPSSDSVDSGYGSKRASDCYEGPKLQNELLREELLQPDQTSSQGKSPTPVDNLNDLQTECSHLRRRLAEEKQANSNFEYLLVTIQNRLQETRDERDALREKVARRLCTKTYETEALQNWCRQDAILLTGSNSAEFSEKVRATLLHDVEAQRDALHHALKGLLLRQEIQDRESRKKFRYLEAQCQKLMLRLPKLAFGRQDLSYRTSR